MSEMKCEGSNTYDHWKAITESDFVTLFIKTWFAFVATLRKMYPEEIPYYLASGDGRYLKNYKNDFAEAISFLCSYEEIRDNMVNVYKHGMERTYCKYPRFLEADFYERNQAFGEEYQEEFSSTGGFGGILELLIKRSGEDNVKLQVKCDDKSFYEKIGTNPVILNVSIDFGTIIVSIIEEIEALDEKDRNSVDLTESYFTEKFYNRLFDSIKNTAYDSLNTIAATIPEKGNVNVHKVFSIIQSFIFRGCDKIKNDCLKPEISDEHKLISQKPITNYLGKYDSINTTEQQRAYLWFVGYVYKLRNALFHEIIDPLDEEWQYLFKNAYLVLKHIVDANIERLKAIEIYINNADSVFEREFRDDPPTQIPIKENNTEFTISKKELVRYDTNGVRIQLAAMILCEGNNYPIECFVEWKPENPNGEVKNVVFHDPIPITA